MWVINSVYTNKILSVATKLKSPVSMAVNFRMKRFSLFKSLITRIPRPLNILDVGGTQEFWEMMAFGDEDVQLTLLNTELAEATLPNVKSMVGDARNMSIFRDQEFEVIFSNAVIEHVGDLDQQQAMAQEIQRLGKRYIIQTPNRNFPVEPHVLIPFFQFFPLTLKIFIANHTPNWGWKAAHLHEIDTIRLMTEKELKNVFPGAKIYKEKFLGMTKSFILYQGW